MRVIQSVVLLSGLCWLIIPGSSVSAKPTCDTLYYELQNLSIRHVRANEIWVEHFLECPPVDGAFGGFVLSDITQGGERDRAVVAMYQESRWQYRFGERGAGIRFAAEPRRDIDGDGIHDFVFIAEDQQHRPARSYRLAFLDSSGNRRSVGGLGLPRDVVVDSILPAPAGRAHALLAADRRGWDIGGLDWDTAPISYQYLDWNGNADPPKYVNRTAAHADEFPVFDRRREFIEQLGDGRLEFETEAEYQTFLINIIGHCLDLLNMNRGEEAYIKATDILERVRFTTATVGLLPPRAVESQLKRVLPKSDKQAGR